MTWRQYRAWHEYLLQQWNEPSLHDWYLMQLTSVVRSLFAQSPYQVKDSKLEFDMKPPPTAEEIAEHERMQEKINVTMSRAALLMRAGCNPDGTPRKN
jgi:hypothetical protein